MPVKEMEKPEALPAPAYAMPQTTVGAFVKWRPAGDSRQAKFVPAIVTKVGYNAVSLNLIMEDSPAMRPMSGVRHISDPDSTSPTFEKFGTWEESDETKLIRELMSLSATIKELQDEVKWVKDIAEAK